MRRAVAGALVVGFVAVTVGACSGGGDDSSANGSELGVTQPPTSVATPDSLAPAKEGTGVVSVGGITSSFAVETCQLTTTTDATGLKTLVHVTGRGTTGGGTPFDVDVARFASGGDIVTYTDTVTYTDAGKIVQAQRYEVNGQVNDLRDPKARSSMIRTRAGGVAAQGVGGPPGAGPNDEGLVGLAVDASCAS